MAALAAVFAIAVLTHSVVIGAAEAAASTTTTERNFTVSSAPSTTKGPVTYLFGDSMSDVGNNNYFAMSLAKSNYPWYGIDYPTREATGRFTNGKTIGDYMADKFVVAPPPPFLSLPLTGNEVLRGINFASGGAGILNETGVYFVHYLSFDEQISCFEIVKKAMIAKVGKEAAEAAVNAALFQIGLRSNDYINNFLQPFMADGTTYTHDQFICLLISTLDRQLKRLYGLGARKVAFNGLAPLGCIPSQRVRSPDGRCLLQVNDYALQFNAAAKKLLDGMNARLPGADGPRRLLLRRHGPHRAPRGTRVHDGAHVVLRHGQGGGRAVSAQHEALQRPRRVRVLGRVPHLRRRQQGHRRPPLGGHASRRPRRRCCRASRRRAEPRGGSSSVSVSLSGQLSRPCQRVQRCVFWLL